MARFVDDAVSVPVVEQFDDCRFNVVQTRALESLTVRCGPVNC